MYSFVSKKTVPFVLSAAVAFSAFTGVIATLVTNDTPLAASTAYAAASKTWDFSQNVGAWSYCGGYNYSGNANVSYDPAFGGSAKVDVDFSQDKEESWSEVKLTDASITGATPLALNDAGCLEFDLYYDPAQIKGDSTFKVKVFATDEKGEEVMNDLADDIGISRAKAVDGSNLKKVHVRVLLMDKFTGKLSHLEVSLVSYLSGYKGAVYINNLSL